MARGIKRSVRLRWLGAALFVAAGAFVLSVATGSGTSVDSIPNQRTDSRDGQSRTSVDSVQSGLAVNAPLAADTRREMHVPEFAVEITDPIILESGRAGPNGRPIPSMPGPFQKPKGGKATKGDDGAIHLFRADGSLYASGYPIDDGYQSVFYFDRDGSLHSSVQGYTGHPGNDPAGPVTCSATGPHYLDGLPSHKWRVHTGTGGWYSNPAMGSIPHEQYVNGLSWALHEWNFGWNYCGFGDNASINLSSYGWSNAQAGRPGDVSDGISVIQFRGDANELCGGSVLACNPMRYNSVPGMPGWSHVVESDIVMNYNHSWFGTQNPPAHDAYDIQMVLAHEMGHTLGMMHTGQPYPPNTELMSGGIQPRDTSGRYPGKGDSHFANAAY